MESFTAEYNKRKLEIEAYLNLLTALDKDGANITDIDGNIFPVSSLANKVCKASTHLIIYNLVEATVSEGVKSIYNKIADEKLGFIEIMEKLRKVWWHSKSISLTTCASNNLIDNIYDYYCEAHNNTPLDFSNFISGVSGNLDADIIRNVCHTYGITPVSDGRDLGSVKQNRNDLAHGNKSFSDIGQDQVPSDLYNVKIRVFDFLDEFVANVNTYLTELHYKNVS
ncbi:MULTISPECIES: MAE_28990/MAE_18760 family HEPN-like nuclease [unclassified Pseudoalteromonas]|uniref:MAE_28990/MAE_18760 family HEPN-like nuclease n=1 Tax=unclassified Pseudoalteromonas TaxID=194690 RepID=UPI00110A425D|nr:MULTISPECIES: MAE_28990/MAE_18760 family HEPN-like nuclease [unclassified Pseudoalteromonas]TMP46845.1 hypothetical protein CWB80_07830 [Pseudoalteromonas sp. S1650]TMP70041.1 hypothetical protein CWB79_01030 [Pseudoalteromonas sp. S1649]